MLSSSYPITNTPVTLTGQSKLQSVLGNKLLQWIQSQSKAGSVVIEPYVGDTPGNIKIGAADSRGILDGEHTRRWLWYREKVAPPDDRAGKIRKNVKPISAEIISCVMGILKEYMEAVVDIEPVPDGDAVWPIFTNGSKDHANNVITHLGINDLFDGLFDIVDAEFSPKPAAKAFDLMVKKFKINPRETLYIEDIAKNLSIGKERGTITAWLINDEYWGKKESDKEFIDYKIENLSLFLKEIRLLQNS